MSHRVFTEYWKENTNKGVPPFYFDFSASFVDQCRPQTTFDHCPSELQNRYFLGGPGAPMSRTCGGDAAPLINDFGLVLVEELIYPGDEAVSVEDKWIYAMAEASCQLVAEVYAANPDEWHMAVDTDTGLPLDTERELHISDRALLQLPAGSYSLFLSPFQLPQGALEYLVANATSCATLVEVASDPDYPVKAVIPDPFVWAEACYRKYFRRNVNEYLRFVFDKDLKAADMLANTFKSWIDLPDGPPENGAEPQPSEGNDPLNILNNLDSVEKLDEYNAEREELEQKYRLAAEQAGAYLAQWCESEAHVVLEKAGQEDVTAAARNYLHFRRITEYLKYTLPTRELTQRWISGDGFVASHILMLNDTTPVEDAPPLTAGEAALWEEKKSSFEWGTGVWGIATATAFELGAPYAKANGLSNGDFKLFLSQSLNRSGLTGDSADALIAVIDDPKIDARKWWSTSRSSDARRELEAVLHANGLPKADGKAAKYWGDLDEALNGAKVPAESVTGLLAIAGVVSASLDLASAIRRSQEGYEEYLAMVNAVTTVSGWALGAYGLTDHGAAHITRLNKAVAVTSIVGGVTEVIAGTAASLEATGQADYGKFVGSRLAVAGGAMMVIGGVVSLAYTFGVSAATIGSLLGPLGTLSGAAIGLIGSALVLAGAVFTACFSRSNFETLVEFSCFGDASWESQSFGNSWTSLTLSPSLRPALQLKALNELLSNFKLSTETSSSPLGKLVIAPGTFERGDLFEIEVEQEYDPATNFSGGSYMTKFMIEVPEDATSELCNYYGDPVRGGEPRAMQLDANITCERDPSQGTVQRIVVPMNPTKLYPNGDAAPAVDPATVGTATICRARVRLVRNGGEYTPVTYDFVEVTTFENQYLVFFADKEGSSLDPDLHYSSSHSGTCNLPVE